MKASDASGTGRLRVGDGAGPGEWVAWSFLGVVLGAVAAGLLWAISTVVSDALCTGEDCRLGWLLLGGMLSVVVGMLAALLVVGLGWAWWSVLAASVLSTPLWIHLPPVWASAVLLVVVTPVLAGLAGWWAARGRSRRTWLFLGLAGVVLLVTALSVFVVPDPPA